jgi:hypothetical protein
MNEQDSGMSGWRSSRARTSLRGVGRLIQPLAILATLTLLVACSSTPQPSASPPATSTPSAAPSSAATPSPAAPSPSVAPSETPATGWLIVPVQPELGPANLVDLASFRGSLVAVGNAQTDLAPGVIWTSQDGESWHSAAGALSLDGIQIESVAAGDPGVVVVGYNDHGAVALFSADGTTWSRQPLPNAVGNGARQVAWGPAGFVAVGDRNGEGFPSGITWWSPDGRSWTRVTKIDGSNHPALGTVAAGPGGYVAVGVDGSRRAAWSSTDGRTWHRLSTSRTVPQVARARLRYVNGRYVLPVGAEVWSSTDGRRWAHARVPGMGNDVFDVAAGPGGGFVAVGRSPAGEQPGEVATADAALNAWTRLPEDPVFSTALAIAILLTPDGTRLVAVGNSETGESIFVADPSILVQP